MLFVMLAVSVVSCQKDNIILIDPEGRILGTGLRGENINRKLSEIFGE